MYLQPVDAQRGIQRAPAFSSRNIWCRTEHVIWLLCVCVCLVADACVRICAHVSQ